MTHRQEPDEECRPHARHARSPQTRKRAALRTLLPGLAALCVAAYSLSVMPPDGVSGDMASTPGTFRDAGQPTSGWRTVTPPEAAAIMEQRLNDDTFMVLDVRTPDEYATGHLAGARNIDLTAPEFRDRMRSLNRNRTYLVYCRSGNRSASALATLRELGFASALHMDGGTLAWSAEGLPLEK